jgi:hypothetical protein
VPHTLDSDIFEEFDHRKGMVALPHERPLFHEYTSVKVDQNPWEPHKLSLDKNFIYQIGFTFIHPYTFYEVYYPHKDESYNPEVALAMAV